MLLGGKKGTIPWNKGKKHTEESKRKMSEGHKGQKQWNTGLTKETDERVRHSAEKKQGKSSWNKGKKSSEEWCRNLSLSLKGRTTWNKGIPRDAETKAKISKTKTGVKHGPLSEETKKKLSIIFKGNHPSPFKGKKRPKFSPEWCKHISEALKGIQSGDKNPNWRGGIAYEPYSFEFNKQLKKEIKNKYNNQCVVCSINESPKIKIHLHHIDYDKKNTAQNNLIPLCPVCHSKTNYNRSHWKDFFTNLIQSHHSNTVEIYTTINNTNNEGGEQL